MGICQVLPEGNIIELSLFYHLFLLSVGRVNGNEIILFPLIFFLKGAVDDENANGYL